MGDRHGWWFKFLSGAYSLLGVGDPTRVHDAMVGRDGLAVVANVHTGALAGGVALALAGPQHAGLLASLLGDLNFVSLGHVSDCLVSRALESLHQSFINIRVHYRASTGVGPGRHLGVVSGAFVPVPFGVGGGINEVVPRSRETPVAAN